MQVGGIPAIQLVDEAIGIHLPCSLAQLFIADIAVAEPDVIRDVIREQEDILRHDAETRAQLRGIDLAYINAVQKYLPALDFIESQEKVCDGSLPCSRVADKSH